MASQSVGDGQAYTVAVIRQSDKTTVGHTSYNLAPTDRLLASRVNRGPGRWIWHGSPVHFNTDSTDVNICI